MSETAIQLIDDHNFSGDFADLVARHLAGELNDAECEQLRADLAAMPERRDEFVAMCIHAHLIGACVGLEVISKDGFGDLSDNEDSLSGQGHAKCPHSFIPTFLSTTLHNPLSNFSESWLVAYSIAAVICGIGILIGAFTYVSQPGQVAERLPVVASDHVVIEPQTDFVGRITGMVNCKWASAAVDSDRVSLGQKYELASGLMEITYNTGAKVILQGPVRYEVESKNGGFLPVGKLTGKVEVEKAKGFLVRTPTATVTDLGTEFGVEVRQDGGTGVYVFDGQVDLVTRTGSTRMQLVANSETCAARVEADAKQIVKEPVTPERFVRVISRWGADKGVSVDWSGFQLAGSFTVASNDLLQTNLLTVRSDDDGKSPPPPLNGQTLAALHDGMMYGPNNEGAYDSTAYSFTVHDGKTVTFVLDTSVNTHGYTIDSIDVYSGYDYYRTGQKYKVDFSQVGQSGWLPNPVVSVDHAGAWGKSDAETHSHIQNRAQGAPLAMHIDRIRFTFYDVKVGSDHCESIYREIDVFGSPTSPVPLSNEPKPKPIPAGKDSEL